VAQEFASAKQILIGSSMSLWDRGHSARSCRSPFGKYPRFRPPECRTGRPEWSRSKKRSGSRRWPAILRLLRDDRTEAVATWSFRTERRGLTGFVHSGCILAVKWLLLLAVAAMQSSCTTLANRRDLYTPNEEPVPTRISTTSTTTTTTVPAEAAPVPPQMR
jgi:hypothetical protein